MILSYYIFSRQCCKPHELEICYARMTFSSTFEKKIVVTCMTGLVYSFLILTFCFTSKCSKIGKIVKRQIFVRVVELFLSKAIITKNLCSGSKIFLCRLINMGHSIQEKKFQLHFFVCLRILELDHCVRIHMHTFEYQQMQIWLR